MGNGTIVKTSDLQQSVDSVIRCGSKAAAAVDLGISRSTLRTRLDIATREGILPTPGIATTSDSKILEMKDEIRTLRAELRQTQRSSLTVDNVRKDILHLRDTNPDPPSWVLKPSSKSADSNPGVPASIWSDWHWGEVVDPDSVYNFNTFNIRTGHERVRLLSKKVVHLSHNCINHDGPYPGIVLCLGGDMLSGDIHEELSETNELTQIEALLDLRGALIWAIDKMREAFGKVFITGVIGNHSRTTRKPRAKQQVVRNMDWLLYVMLEHHYQDVGAKDIAFSIPVDNESLFNIYDHRYLLQHGDTIGAFGGDGIIGELGPITRGDFKMRRSLGGLNVEYDTMLLGHWHHLIRLGGVMVNGSLKGYCEYAKKIKAKPELPQQLFWFTRPNGRIVWDSPIVLDGGKKKVKAEWVRWER